MATDLQYIRLTLNLPYHMILRESLGTGDGASTRYQTQLWPIIAESETIRVSGVVQARNVDYTIENDLGLVTFTVAPSDGLSIDADYKWSVFSDVQITDLLARYNEQVRPAMRDLVMALLANSDLFIKYTVGMESVDRTKALDALQKLYSELKEEPSGGAQAVVWMATDVKAYERDIPWEDFVSSIPED